MEKKVFIEPLEKGNLIPKSSVDALFSNWRSLLGINQELLRQMEELSCYHTLNSNEEEEEESNDSEESSKVFVRVTFQKYNISKTLLVTSTHTGRDLVQMAIKKVLTSLPTNQHEAFLDHYEFCELFNDNETYGLSKKFLSLISIPKGDTPQVTIRKASKKATDIGECFLQMVSLLIFFQTVRYLGVENQILKYLKIS